MISATDMVRGDGVDEAGRLLAVDSLHEVSVKKCILHVQLVDRPGARSGDAEDGPYRHRFDNLIEGLVIVDAVALAEATNHPARLVPGEGPIGMELMPEDPLARHDIGTGRLRDEAPGVIIDEGLELVDHGSMPVGVS